MQQRGSAERRAYPRVMPAGQVRVEVGAASIERTTAIVEDISLGGVRLALGNARMDPDERQCVVHFTGPSGVTPSTSRGWIRRSGRQASHVYLAVEFTEPLVHLDLTRTSRAMVSRR